MRNLLLCLILAFGMEISAIAQITPGPQKEPLTSCMQNPKGTFVGRLRITEDKEAPGGRVFVLFGQELIIIFDLPPGTEKAEPALARALTSKDTVELSWTGSYYIPLDQEHNERMEVYTGAQLRLTTDTGVMRCLRALYPTPMLIKDPPQERKA